MSACIDPRGVRCTLAGRTVLDIERLVVGEGERIALVGHNGAVLTAVDSRTNPASTAGTAQHDLDLVSG